MPAPPAPDPIPAPPGQLAAAYNNLPSLLPFPVSFPLFSFFKLCLLMQHLT